ncbi:MAG: transcription elongation factor GreA [Dehalococcoidia bacterium]
MDNVAKLTLSAMASQFLSSLPQEERQESQPMVTKFIRWCGRDRAISEVTNQEVAQYASGLGNSPGAAQDYEYVRAFLTYAYKQGATRANLATNFRVKKGSSLAPTPTRGPRAVTELTEEGFGKLRAELKELKERRVGIAEELRRAAADKDFRENAPLEAAREQQGQVESRIRDLEATLNSAVILKRERPRDKRAIIAIGNSVSIKDLSSGEELQYLLVAPNEANLANGRLSVTSPVGKALLGRAKGEEVEVKVPAGTFRYRIKGISA